MQFNNSIQYTEISSNGYNPTATSSIGIIGGADGPIAIFVTSKEKSPLLHSCLSIPSFQKEKISYFNIEGINVKVSDEQEYEFKY